MLPSQDPAASALRERRGLETRLELGREVRARSRCGGLFFGDTIARHVKFPRIERVSRRSREAGLRSRFRRPCERMGISSGTCPIVPRLSKPPARSCRTSLFSTRMTPVLTPVPSPPASAGFRSSVGRSSSGWREAVGSKVRAPQRVWGHRCLCQVRRPAMARTCGVCCDDFSRWYRTTRGSIPSSDR